MAFNERRKPRLYSDLFKCSEKEDENIVMSSSSTSGSGSSSTSGSGSSSSGFSTPLYSDLESDGGDFIAELTRQMAECMLEDEDDDTESKHVKNKEEMDYGVTNSLKNGFKSAAVCTDNRFPLIQAYELKNETPVNKQGQFCRGRRVKGTESAHQKTHHHSNYYNMQHRGRNGHFGSGMQAVFLGGFGSASGSTGTGVFLPRMTSDPDQLKKKPGCPIVLMPTRVLQALDLHFKQRRNSSVPPTPLTVCGNLIHKDESSASKGNLQLETNSDAMQLPQEWTY